MIAVLIRLWRSVNWSGLYGAIVLIAISGLVVWQLAAHLPLRLPPWGLLLMVALIVGSLVRAVVRWGHQQRPIKTTRWEEVVAPLVQSREEYCLILRPFGADGRVVLPYRERRIPLAPGAFTSTSPLEQVVAIAVNRALGLKTYAVVDQKQLLAPPGPTWLRTSTDGDDWQRPVSALIRRAHSIILILPPGQEVRAALKWEIKQIALHDLQTRVLIVLPPPDRDEEAYLRVHRQACQVLTTFEGSLGELDDVDQLKVDRYHAVLSKETVVARTSRHPVTGQRNVSWWTGRRKRGARVGVASYRQRLTEALKQIGEELSGQPFETRYPEALPSLPASTPSRGGRDGVGPWRVGALLLPWVARLLVVLLAVTVAVVAWRWHDANIASQAADSMIDSMVDPRQPSDRYGKLRLTLRAFQTAENDKTREAVRERYAMFAEVDRTLPDYLGQATVIAGDRSPPVDEPSAFPNKVSADGRTLATTDANGELTIWQVDGDQVTRQGTRQTAERVTVSRSGRYVAYTQNTVPAVLGPPFTACAQPTGGLDPCLFLHDVPTGRSRMLGRLENASILGHVPVVRIDPTDRMVAAAVPVVPFRERIMLWDVATGVKRADITVPGQVTGVLDMWLLPGGRSVVLEAVVPRSAGSRLDRTELLWLDLSHPDTPAATVLTPEILNATTSLDGTRLAAVVVTSIDNDGLHSDITVWDIATRQPIAHVPNLSRSQSAGTVSLDPNGSRIHLVSREPSPTRGLGRQLNTWSTSDSRPVDAPVWLDNGWTLLVPLSGGDTPPVALVTDNVVGLVLPRQDRPAPLERLADRSTAPDDLASPDDAGRWQRELCDSLVSTVEPRSITDHLPPGAYTGPLCQGR